MKNQQIDKTKKHLFTVIMALTPFILLILFELVLRLFSYGGNQRLFVTGPEKQISHYWMCNQNVGKRYFYMLGSVPSPPKDLFLKKKPENGYRIFVIGGSTAAGFPYSYNLMFPRILDFQLADIFPDKHIEVVNTAMSAVNSYTLLDFMDEILAKEPDAILMYAGHNEYYGAMGVGSQESFSRNPKFIYAYLQLKRFKTFLLVRDIVGALKKSVSKATTGSTDMDPSNTLMARIVGEQTIPYKSDMYNQGLEQYEENLRRIIQKAHQNNVPLIMSELVSNIKDQPPFISVKADTLPTAKKAYSIGRQLLNQGHIEDARTALLLAKDLDALRFRASEEMNERIRSLGQEFNVPVVPMVSFFEANSNDSIIGQKLLCEHLHPNARGYFIMADAFLKTMRDNNFISTSWNKESIKPVDEMMQNWGWTEIDTASANLSIHYLKGGWPFKPKVMPNHALENYSPKTRAESLSVRILTEKKYNEVVAHIDMAKHFESKQQYDKAFEEYRAAYYTIPFELEFYEKAVQNLLRLERFKQALHILTISHRYGSTPLTNKWMGQLLTRAGRYAKAIPWLQMAQQEFPQDKQLLSHLAHCYDKTGETDKAKKLADKHGVTTLTSPGADSPAQTNSSRMVYSVLIQKSQEFLKKKNYKEALPILRQAHAIKPDQFTFKWIGMLDLTNGNFEEAVDYLSTVIEAHPDDFQTFYNLCNGYIKLGRKKEAAAALRAMEKLRPNFNDPQDLRTRVAQL